MLSLETARQLKAAGLPWAPRIHDFFVIPDRSMDERTFVISDMLVTVEMLQGLQVVSFQGASEWALDSLVTTEAIWLPSEGQLRQLIEAALLATPRPELHLRSSVSGYRCEFIYQGQPQTFEHRDAGEAYAAGLLYILRQAKA